MGMLTTIVWADRPTLKRCVQLCELRIHWKNYDAHLISTITSTEIRKITITRLTASQLPNEKYLSYLDRVLCTLVEQLQLQRRLEVEIQLVDIPENLDILGRETDYLLRFRGVGGRVNFADSKGRIVNFLRESSIIHVSERS